VHVNVCLRACACVFKLCVCAAVGKGVLAEAHWCVYVYFDVFLFVYVYVCMYTCVYVFFVRVLCVYACLYPVGMYGARVFECVCACKCRKRCIQEMVFLLQD
jgi:hypothetical protein